jgi:predicted XRE-type DNA-binding protein
MDENTGKEIRITLSCDNVFTDPGIDPAEAEVMKLRTEVMRRTIQQIKTEGWTQAEAARHLRIAQPRISRLLKGHVKDFSLDMLLTLATRLGLHPELRLPA